MKKFLNLATAVVVFTGGAVTMLANDASAKTTVDVQAPNSVKAGSSFTVSASGGTDAAGVNYLLCIQKLSASNVWESVSCVNMPGQSGPVTVTIKQVAPPAAQKLSYRHIVIEPGENVSTKYDTDVVTVNVVKNVAKTPVHTSPVIVHKGSNYTISKSKPVSPKGVVPVLHGGGLGAKPSSSSVKPLLHKGGTGPLVQTDYVSS